jgi:high-affinity Fe2+/Pb2+ permease
VPDPTGHSDFGARVLDIAVLVFREGLECILVLSAITANMVGARRTLQRPVAAGALSAFFFTLLTWYIAISIIDNLSENVPALDLQAATGLLAILVLLLVMNWFFHKVYWAGWISMHSRRKQVLLTGASNARLWWGLALLGFSSFYREGFEIVLFLQSYRLKLGAAPLTSEADVFASFGIEPEEPVAGERSPLLELLPASVDELVRSAGLAADEVARRLVELEIEGRVAVHDGIYRSTS